MSVVEMESTKYSIIELLLKTRNESLINAIFQSLEMDINGKDFYDDLTEKDKKDIELAKSQIAKGLVFSNEEVMADLGKRYKK